ncbi:3-hydroxyacyl-CoA dehydrogenase NAD-binding domain-containing protein [Bordetella sp. BOR01]|uniref:3-hydroxyacyl-CoA dehydrogenase NAD-binding domain-containing protein n=1 Tax=Bordetella sp. BOR01 TaxID=2854779 RepID=UPI001C450663|nr:3-hydroxyacyl-CoA dehydrogenase NAD-binding domain-containing protein [Bordetella sp. BOR01]MBV7484647.1 enoyl-CoA hydratase/isomerase family protein [Bordetella sp. BOR01]
MTHSARLAFETGIAFIEIDSPPVNALSRSVLQQLRDCIAQAGARADCRAVVLYGAGRSFVCGADIAELDRAPGEGDAFNPVMDALESLAKPVICSIHGMALGGGLELALACHYRVAHTHSTMGLPEVKLGILPGAGGTQRLPRLVGAAMALDMISSGKPIDAQAALQAGLVDRLSEHDARTAGLQYAQDLLRDAAPARPTRARTVVAGGLDAPALQAALADAGKHGAYPARLAIVQCIQAALDLPFEEGRHEERRLFEQCRASETSRALCHLFFAEREAAKLPGLPAQLALRPVEKIGVVGAGTMGRGIIMNFLNAGMASVLLETSAEALERGVEQIRATYQGQVAKGRLSQARADAALALLRPTLDDAAMADCDLVIEAVFENMEVKQQVCRKLGQLCKPGAILATNTSTLDVDELAAASGRPADFLGMHFFSPAHVMRLLEVVRGRDTATDVLATVMKLAKTIRKTAVVSGVCYGFIGNRMLESYLREADFLLMEGATPRQIDRAIEAAGLAMGPCRMLDMAGTDVAAKIVLEQGKTGMLPDDPSYRAVVGKLFEHGRMGQKAGRGYYRHEGRSPVDDPEVDALCQALAARHGIARRERIDDEEIVERCLYPLINEGARILDEGIAYRPGDIDIVWTHGYGFPDYRGGPIFMADRIGLRHIRERLRHYGARHGNAHGYWTVAPLLDRRAIANEPLSHEKVLPASQA